MDILSAILEMALRVLCNLCLVLSRRMRWMAMVMELQILMMLLTLYTPRQIIYPSMGRLWQAYTHMVEIHKEHFLTQEAKDLVNKSRFLRRCLTKNSDNGTT